MCYVLPDVVVEDELVVEDKGGGPEGNTDTPPTGGLATIERKQKHKLI